MARFKVYLKPFLDNGSYAPDFYDISEDVISLSVMNQSIENNEYDVGVIRSNGLTITLRNDTGRYLDADDIRSIFRYKRKSSIIRVTWDARDADLICGCFYPGLEILGGEQEIFRGLLEDVNSISDIQKQNAVFTVLGYDSFINEMPMPFTGILNAGVRLRRALDQAPLNEVTNVDFLSWELGHDFDLDTLEPFEGKTVGETIGNLLLATSSVLYVDMQEDGTYKTLVKTRDASDDLKYTFFGQASNKGIENVLNIPSFKDGLNRVFNYWYNEASNTLVQDVASITRYGIRKKELALDFLTDPTKIRTALTINLDAFSYPKRELELHAPIWYDVLNLKILDRVAIDYPTVFSSSDNNPLPRYGIAKYGEARYPYGQWSLTLTPDTHWKILGRRIDPTKQTIIFKLREI